MLGVKSLFTPLGKEYCDWFYILSVFFFVLFVVAIFTVVATVYMKKEMTGTNAFLLLTQPLLLYFINRLYYSMCVNSL